MRFTLLAALAALSLTACARNIPNTDIRDTPDNRAIIEVIDAYRKGLDQRNVDAVMALVSKNYYDDGGTLDAADDVDYYNLPQILKETFAKISQVRIEFGVTAIEVTGNKASADLFYDAKYRVATPRTDVTKRDTDLQRVKLQREGESWKFVTGL